MHDDAQTEEPHCLDMEQLPKASSKQHADAFFPALGKTYAAILTSGQQRKVTAS